MGRFTLPPDHRFVKGEPTLDSRGPRDYNSTGRSDNVLPRFTDTRRLRSLIVALATRRGVSEAEVEKGMLATVPLGRFASPDETAAAVALLAGPTARYITGISLPVDGGRTESL